MLSMAKEGLREKIKENKDDVARYSPLLSHPTCHFSIPGGTGFLHAAPGLDQLRKTLLGDGFVNWGDFWQAVWLG
jgi:hypothetical protein